MYTCLQGKLKISTFLTSLFVLPLLAVAFLSTASSVNAQTPPWPTTPPAQICENEEILGDGPIATPSGALTVPAGDNSAVNFTLANTTYWFMPGTHTLGSDQFSQIIPGDNSTFIGAPGAILDGQNINQYAFTQHSEDVRIAYLEIRNFVTPRDEGAVNHDSGQGWTVEYNWIHDNGGAGVFAGTDNVLRYNCLQDNGQYGFQVYSGDTNEVGPSNITIDHNEVVGNNTDDWETEVPGCGCTGGAKFWLSNGTIVTNNWVHDNHSVGLWFDNNNRGTLIEHNYIEENEAQAVFLEAGYDAQVRYNTFKRNAIESGRRFATNNDPFPVGAIYISESGSPEGYGLTYAPTLISNNYFEDNWGGVNLWENADRYSGSSAHTHSSGTIKMGDLEDDSVCESETSDDIPDNLDPFDCRWSTENVIVEENEFHLDKSAIGTGCAGANYCGINGIFANVGTYPEFSGYQIPWRITFQQDNIFRNNDYFGDWHFAGFQTTRPDDGRVTWADWTAPAASVPAVFTSANRPTTFGQDDGSTLTGAPTGTPTPTPTPGGPTSTPTPTPTPSGPTFTENHLDANTATLESAIGQWSAWFSTSIARSNEEAHSGTYSLKIDVTEANGWGVELANWPGFAATPGNKVLSLWAKLGTGTQTPTMTVKWLNSSNALLQTDTVPLPTLTSSWQKASANVTAPAGTSTVLVTLTGPGSSGNSLYIDDVVVGDSPNAIDHDTADLEGSIGEWVDWYSVASSRTNAEAHSGTYSLLAEVTELWGWGVQVDAWPGFEATPGTKRLSYWVKQGVGDISTVTLQVKWFDENEDLLQTDLVVVNDVDTSWKQGVADVIAPIGTTDVHLEVYSNQGDVDDTVYLDDFSVTNIVNILDNDTANLEGQLGEWATWYSANVSTSTQQSYFDTHSLVVEVTDLWGWGIQFDSWPGVSATPGNKKISYWAKRDVGNDTEVTLEVQWFDAEEELLQTDEITLENISTDWKQATDEVNAPAGTTHMHLEFSSPLGEIGDTIYLDGIIAAPISL